MNASWVTSLTQVGSKYSCWIVILVMARGQFAHASLSGVAYMRKPSQMLIVIDNSGLVTIVFANH